LKLLISYSPDAYVEYLPETVSLGAPGGGQDRDRIFASEDTARSSGKSSRIPESSAANGPHTATFRSKKSSFNFISVIPGGYLIPQSQTVHLITRSIQRFVFMHKLQEPSYQAITTQTPNLIVGVHNQGTFDKVYTFQLKSGPIPTDNIRKLRRVLEVVVEQVMKYGTREPLTLVVRGKELKLYKRVDGTNPVPDDLAEFFVSRT
jgi:hypothetical protein